MDSFELNKIIGAILGTLLFVMGVGLLAEVIYHPIEDRGPGYLLAEAEVLTGGEPAEAEPTVPLGILLASANVDAGLAAARRCSSCHNFEAGAGNKQGPELYGVVGRLEGSHPGFAYSDALLANNAAGIVWTYENLDHFLEAPRDYAPGTKMVFAGIRDPQERANILAYMSTLSDDPVPFPPPVDDSAPAEDDGMPEDGAGADEIAPTAEDIAPSDQDAVPVAPTTTIETPSTTQTDTMVEGTPAPATSDATTTP